MKFTNPFRTPWHRRVIKRGRKIVRNKTVQRRAIQVALGAIGLMTMNWLRKLRTHTVEVEVEKTEPGGRRRWSWRRKEVSTEPVRPPN